MIRVCVCRLAERPLAAQTPPRPHTLHSLLTPSSWAEKPLPGFQGTQRPFTERRTEATGTPGDRQTDGQTGKKQTGGVRETMDRQADRRLDVMMGKHTETPRRTGGRIGRPHRQTDRQTDGEGETDRTGRTDV